MEHDQDKRVFEELRRISVELTSSAAKYALELSESSNINRIISRNPLGDTTREIDVLIEKYVIEEIKRKGLFVKLVSEEIGVTTIGNDPQLVMVLDPLDGSLNYVTQTPYCSVSIAIAFYRENNSMSLKDTIAGSISEIFRPITYSFSYGNGAYINDKKANHVDQYRRSDIVLTYFDKPELFNMIHKAISILDRAKIRSMGSASLDIVKTSLSYYKAFIDLRGKLRNVDIAAAYGFAREINTPISFIDRSSSDIPLDRLSLAGSIIVSRDNDTHLKIMSVLKDAIIR